MLLDKETRMEKLTSLDKYLGAAMVNEEGPEGKIIMRIMPLLTHKKTIKDLFKGSKDELAIERSIISQCAEYLKNSISKAVS